MAAYEPDMLPASPWRTDRLMLRSFDESDADLAHEAFDQHPDVWQHDPGFARTRDQRAGVIARFQMLHRQFGFGPCAAFLIDGGTDDGALIGQGGLNPYVYDHRDGSRTVEFEVMYKLVRPFWGKGFATEIAAFWVDFAFRHVRLPRLFTCPVKTNTGSIAVLRRLGARFEDDWLDPETTIAIIENPIRDFKQRS